MLQTVAVTAVAAMAALTASPASAVPAPKNIGEGGEYWFTLWAVSSIWSGGAEGQGVTVAVIDTGVQADTAGLAGVVLSGGTDFAGGDGRSDPDDTGHGTRMAQFIAGQGGSNGEVVGVAPKAKILPISIPTGAGNSEEVFAKSIRYAADHGAKVINISEAANAPQPTGCEEDLQAAVKYAVDKGSIVVSGAGNKGQEGNPRQAPAACFGVVAVGAVDAALHVWSDSERQDYVDVAAPGVHMYSRTPAGVQGYSDGTSDASAVTSGALALIWSKFPKLTNRQVVAHMLATVVDDADTPGKDTGAGYGVVRPHTATRTQPSGNEPNPIFDELAAVTTPTTSATTSAAPTTGGTGGAVDGSTAPPTAQASGNSNTVFIAVAGIALVVIVIAVAVIGSRRRRPRPSNGTGPGPSW